MKTFNFQTTPLLIGFFTLCINCTTEPTVSRDDEAKEQVEEKLDLTGFELAIQGFGEDPHEIGSRWYDYSPRTHVLTPKPIVYRLLEEGEAILLLHIESYYDERGESGVFTLNYKTSEAPHEMREVVLPSIKGEIVCLTKSLKATPCEGEETLLVARISPRVIPDAGFTVHEPGIYLHQPYDPISPSPRFTIEHIASDNMQDLSMQDEGVARPSSYLPDHSRIGWLTSRAEPTVLTRRDVYLHATSTLHVAQWQAVSLEVKEERATLKVKVACQHLDPAGESSFALDAVEEVAITLPLDRHYAGQAITLCDMEQETRVSGEQVATFDKSPGALWPEEPYDLLVAQHEGLLMMRPAPGTLLLNWSGARGQEDAVIGAIDLANVWSEHLE